MPSEGYNYAPPTDQGMKTLSTGPDGPAQPDIYLISSQGRIYQVPWRVVALVSCEGEAKVGSALWEVNPPEGVLWGARCLFWAGCVIAAGSFRQALASGAIHHAVYSKVLGAHSAEVPGAAHVSSLSKFFSRVFQWAFYSRLASAMASCSAGVRPERAAAQADAFYSKSEARKYNLSARMQKTQRHLSERALHLLNLTKPNSLILDLGCGTGYSGKPLERAGHYWIGLDVSQPMLEAARRPDRKHDVAQADIGARLPLRQRLFDGAISISAVQWLCFDTNNHDAPKKRVGNFFRGLKAVLAPGARAVLQIYPEQPSHMQMLRESALLFGFSGFLLFDYPKSERSKKLYLVLTSPSSAAVVSKADKSRVGVAPPAAKVSSKSKWPLAHRGGDFASRSKRSKKDK